MRFFFVLFFFSLLWCNHALSQKINIENKIILNVPNNFIFIEGDSKSEFIEPIIDFLGNDVKTYLIGTKDSVNFTKLYHEVKIEKEVAADDLYLDKEMKFYAGHTGFNDEYTRLKIEEGL